MTRKKNISIIKINIIKKSKQEGSNNYESRSFIHIFVFSNYCMILGLIKKIGQWGIFSKAGISEWKSLVPVYNQIQLLKICKLSPWLVVLYLDFLIPIIGFYAGRDVSWTFIIMLIGFLCYRFMIAVRLGYCYKKGAVLPFFMAFFPSIFFPIIGCSKKEEYTELVIQKKSKRKDK